jgi:hypothetical protein
MTKILIASAVSVLMLMSTAAWAGPEMPMKEGQWEMTIETEMEGMPMKMPPSTFSQCVTKKEPVPQDQQQGQTCKTKDVVVKGDTVSWTMVCDTPAGSSTGQGKIAYKGDTMEGTMTMQVQGMKMISRFSGRYTGPCTQKQ